MGSKENEKILKRQEKLRKREAKIEMNGISYGKGKKITFNVDMITMFQI